MVLFFEANFIQVIALCIFAGTLFTLYFRVIPNKPAQIKWFGLFFFLILGGVFLFNALIDPFGWLNLGVIEPVAVQDRREKLALYEALPTAPEILVLGSSRSMMLDPAQIQDKCDMPAFNAAVSNAKIEDHLAIVEYFRQEHPPKYLIIGLDIHALAPDSGYGAQAIMTPFYDTMDLTFTERLNQYWDIFIQYLSLDMTLKSYDSLTKAFTKTRPPDLYTFNPLGRVIYEPYEQQIAAGTFIPNIVVPSGTPFPENFTKFDARRVQALEKILQQSNNVYIFLPPKYPAYLEALQKDPVFKARYADMIALLDNLQESYDFQWYDFTDINSFGGDAAQFYDVIHYYPENAERLLAIILRDMCS